MKSTYTGTGSTTARPMPPPGGGLAGASIRTTKTNTSGPGPEVMAASTLQRDVVVNNRQEKLGTITDIMIDVPSGRIAYAVLSFGGILGLGDKLFAVPWSALTLDADRKCFLLDVDKDRLQNAPGFDKRHWPSMADPQWANDIHSFYGTTPYWN